MVCTLQKGVEGMKWMLDLFAGLGGASEAFVRHPDWDVVRVDNNPILQGVQHMRMHDILNWMDWLPGIIEEMGGPPSLIWASPECKYFSTAFEAPRSRAQRAGEEYEPDMSQVEAVEDILDAYRPRWWVVENVSGACTYFPPYFGDLAQKITGVHLWGLFPKLNLPQGYEHHKFEGDTWSTDPMRYNKRSLIPFEISEALLVGIQSQRGLEDWI